MFKEALILTLCCISDALLIPVMKLHVNIRLIERTYITANETRDLNRIHNPEGHLGGD